MKKDSEAFAIDCLLQYYNETTKTTSLVKKINLATYSDGTGETDWTQFLQNVLPKEYLGAYPTVNRIKIEIIAPTVDNLISNPEFASEDGKILEWKIICKNR